MLIITTDTYTRMIYRGDHIRASNCLQLRDQHPDCLQRLFAKPALSCQLVRSDHAFIDFIEQKLTYHLEMIEGLVDDRKRAGEHSGLPRGFL